MSFAEWIRLQGGPRVVAAKLGITHDAIYKWLYGKARPRATIIGMLIEMGGGKLTVADILEPSLPGKTGRSVDMRKPASGGRRGR